MNLRKDHSHLSEKLVFVNRCKAFLKRELVRRCRALCAAVPMFCIMCQDMVHVLQGEGLYACATGLLLDVRQQLSATDVLA